MGLPARSHEAASPIKIYDSTWELVLINSIPILKCMSTMGMDDARDAAVAMEATRNSNMFQWEHGRDVSGIRGRVKNKSPLHDSYVTLGTILLL